MKVRLKAILSGMSTYLPGYNYMRATGGTSSARYCYAVWLRHLIMAYSNGLIARPPKVVAELGPGDSIGIGLAALLSSAEKYHALDIVDYAKIGNNLYIFNELIQLFQNRQAIPSNDEFPNLKPELRSYAFPHHILTEEVLDTSLATERVARIKHSIEHSKQPYSMIHYIAPWNDPKVILENSIDMLYSQAVLEHVNNLSEVYRIMNKWLKSSGFMSHQIDFKCHGNADTWNGHWTYSDITWKVVLGRWPYLLNREPHSTHIKLLQENGFKIVCNFVFSSPSTLKVKNLSSRFKSLSEKDLTTSGAFMQSVIINKVRSITG